MTDETESTVRTTPIPWAEAAARVDSIESGIKSSVIEARNDAARWTIAQLAVAAVERQYNRNHQTIAGSMAMVHIKKVLDTLSSVKDAGEYPQFQFSVTDTKADLGPKGTDNSLAFGHSRKGQRP